MSYTAIKDHIAEIYQLEVSEATISSITDQLIPQLKAWQSRPLDSVYPFVWLKSIKLSLPLKLTIVSCSYSRMA